MLQIQESKNLSWRKFYAEWISTFYTAYICYSSCWPSHIRCRNGLYEGMYHQWLYHSCLHESKCIKMFLNHFWPSYKAIVQLVQLGLKSNYRSIIPERTVIAKLHWNLFIQSRQTVELICRDTWKSSNRMDLRVRVLIIIWRSLIILPLACDVRNCVDLFH